MSCVSEMCGKKIEEKCDKNQKKVETTVLRDTQVSQ
jgi:hypothetical protein